MASDITPSSSTWATTSMKPAGGGGEEASGVWAAQIADNTGWLFNRKEALFMFPTWVDSIGSNMGTFGTSFAADSSMFILEVYKSPTRGTLYYNVQGWTEYFSPNSGTMQIWWRGTLNKKHNLITTWTAFTGTVPMDAATLGINHLEFKADITFNPTTVLAKNLFIQTDIL